MSRKQIITLSTTTTGVQVAFSEPVNVTGTKWGTRIALTDEDAVALHERLGSHLAGKPHVERIEENKHE